MSSNPSFTPSVPSTLWQSINRFVASREVVVSCARVNKLWRAAASQPFSTKVLPPDDDSAGFLSSRPGHIWPFRYNPFAKDTAEIKRKLNAILQSPFSHQVRIWPTIPISDYLEQFTQLRYLHTLHLTTDTQWSHIRELFNRRPFPFPGLHSLSLPFLSTALIATMPVMNDLRRLALTDRVMHETITTRVDETVRAFIRFDYPTMVGVQLDAVKNSAVLHATFHDAVLQESERWIVTSWTSEAEAKRLAEHWTKTGTRIGHGQPRYTFLTLQELETDGPKGEHRKDMWKILATKMPRLLYLDLPANFPITPACGILEFIRATDLVQVEGEKMFAQQALERLIAEPAPASLQAVLDCSFQQQGHASKYLQAALDDRVLEQMIKLPGLTKLIQPCTQLSSLLPLNQIADRLREFTIAGQALSASLAVNCGRVFPELTALRVFTVRNLQATGSSPLTVCPYYLDLLRAIRTFPAVQKIVLHEMPLGERQFRALLADEAKDRAAAEEAAKHTLDDEPGAASLDDDEPGPLAPCVLRLSDLHLIDINLHLFRTPAPEPTATIDGDCFALVLNESKLTRNCRVKMERVFPMEEEMKARYRAYFAGGSLIK
jgi:hypothetical protein